jgi:hypothetical protein
MSRAPVLSLGQTTRLCCLYLNMNSLHQPSKMQILEHPSRKDPTPPSTPSPPSTPLLSEARNMTESQQIAERIKAIHCSLQEQAHDLRPSPLINQLLTNLVELCIEPCSEETANQVLSLISEFEIKNVREMCGRAEGFLETFWANKMIAVAEEKRIAGMNFSMSSDF